MKKKILLSILLAAAFAAAGFSQSMEELTSKYQQNQQKIKTFWASGTSNIKLYAGDKTAPLKEISSEMSIYLKYPNMFKMVSRSPQKVTLIQKNGYQTQIAEGMGGVVTSKIDESNDMMKYYFGGNISGYGPDADILEQSTVIEDGETLFRFVLNSQEEAMKVPGAEAIKIDRIELFINESGMIKKSNIYSGDTVIVSIQMEYAYMKEIFLPKTIITNTSFSGMIMESVIHYEALAVNKEILDREFDIR